jgi:L-Ala-D/L-Glu epimerase
LKIRIQPFTVHKRFPLTISRGTTTQTTNIWVRIEQDGIEGWGEASPFSGGGALQSTEMLERSLKSIIPILEPLHPLEQQKIEQQLIQAGLPSAAQAAIDIALQDWLGKQVGLPLWQLWGLDLHQIPPTSVTIGINTPEAAQQRLQAWQEVTDVRALKVKLGNPTGLAADQAMLSALLAIAPQISQWSVDANGGWSLENAIIMSNWLADRGVTYIEQPLAKGHESDLKALFTHSPLPIFVDESCFNSLDIPFLADRVHGINIKLMKCGGLTEARRMIHTAKACGLDVMFGCYSDSSLSITAACQLTSQARYVDLDSHLNLMDDPFTGAVMAQGWLRPPQQPGLGVQAIHS